MQQDFDRILRKLRRNTAVQGGLIGAAAGMAVIAVWMAVSKWLGAEILWLWCALAAAGVAALFGVGFFLLRRPSAARLASAIDARCGLRERVATMVAFGGEDGEMVRLQREDAARRLSEVPAKQLRYGKLWLCVASAAVAAGLVLGAVVLPTKAEELPDSPPSPDDSFALSEWQRLAMADLIAHVRASEMEPAPRENVALELEELLSVLEVTTTRTGLVKTVGETVIAMDKLAEDANTLSELKKALVSSQKEAVALLGKTVNKLNDPIAEEQFDLLKAALTQHLVAGTLGEFSVDLDISLAASGVLATDPLYAVLHAFGARLASEEKDGTASGSALANAGLELEDGIALALAQQFTNRDTVDYAVNRILKIFGMSASELPDEFRNGSLGGDVGDYEEKEDENIGGGGLGDGEVDYGSNDKIYDPITGEHVAYGSVLNGYLGMVEGKRQDGLLPDGAEEGIDRYFGILYGDTQKDEE